MEVVLINRMGFLIEEWGHLVHKHVFIYVRRIDSDRIICVYETLGSVLNIGQS